MPKVFSSIINQIEAQRIKHIQELLKNWERSKKIHKCQADLEEIKDGKEVDVYPELNMEDKKCFESLKLNPVFARNMVDCAQDLGYKNITLDSLDLLCAEAARASSNETNIKAALLSSLISYTHGKTEVVRESENLQGLREAAVSCKDSFNPNASTLLKSIAYITCSKAESYLEAPAVKCLAANDYIDAFLEWLH